MRFSLYLAPIFALFLVAAAPAQTETIAYWAQNDNNLPNGGFGFQPGDFPQSPDVGSGSLTLLNFNDTVVTNDNGDDVYQFITSTAGSTINALDGFDAGGSLTPQGGANNSNNGMSILISVSTEGFEDIVVSWAQRGTNTGFNSRQFAWSADGGTTFTDFGSDSGTLGSSFQVQAYGLVGVSELNDNANVVFRITLDGATGATGNNRFDNIRVAGTPLGGEPVDPRENIFSEDFASDPFANGWTDQNVVGNQTWSWSSNFQNVEFSAFAGGCQVNDNWLVSPSIDLDGFEAIELDFVLSRDFSGTNDLLIYYSVDYPGSGDPLDFTWELIETIDAGQLPANNTNYDFGPFDALDEVEGEVRLAFRTGFESGDDCGTWRVVDVQVSGIELAASFCAADAGTDDTLTRIHAIQGDGFASPIVGSAVEVQAVVVGAFQDTDANQIGGFFLQELDANADDNPMTSEGVFISEFQASASIPEVQIGQEVRIAGVVRERFGQTEVFQISNFEVCAEDRLAEVSPAVVEFPVDDLIELEAVEGMWVRLPQAMAVTEVFNAARFAEFTVAPDRLFQPTQVVAPGADANALQDLNDRSRLIIDQGLEGAYRTPYQPGLDGTPMNATNPIRAGYRLQADFDGVMGFGFSNYRLFALQPAEFDDSESPRSVTPPELPEGNLRVASFNVENLFNTIQTGGVGCGPNNLNCRGATSESELARQLIKVTEALLGLNADLVGLVEIENDDDDATLGLLVDALNALEDMADEPADWTFVPTGFTGTDAIKNAIIYRTGQVAPVGPPAILDGSVSVSPPFDDSRQRPVLAQAFEHLESGQIMTLSVFHLRSKNCGSNASGANLDQGDGQGCWNALRTESVESFLNWFETDPTGTGTDLHLLSGDFNAYGLEDPMQALMDAGYINQAIRANGDDPAVYSYIFQGQSGSLDHVLASPALNDLVLGATNWAINADENRSFAYPETLPDSSLTKPEDFFNEDPFRSSDHDPLIVSLDLPRAPAMVQLAHLAPFAAGPDSEVEIRINGEVIASAVAYGDSTGYLALDAGPAEIEIFPAGSAEPAITATAELGANLSYTVIAVGDGSNQDLALTVLVDDLSTPVAGQFKLRLGHLAPFADGSASAEVRLADGSLLAAVDFGDVGDFVELPAGSYDLVITAPGGEPVLIDPVAVDFMAGDIVSAFATGNGEAQILGAFALPVGQPGFFLDLNAEVIFEDSFQVFTGEALEITVMTNPPGLAVEVSYDGADDLPVDAGAYLVTATIVEPGYVGSGEITFEIAPATAGLAFESLSQRFTGEGLAPSVVTDPAGLSFALSFDGSTALPVEVGDYIVAATIEENNFIGSANAIFRILAADAQALNLTQQPEGFNLFGQPLTPALVVEVIDGTGEVADDDNETVIELRLLQSIQTDSRASPAFASVQVVDGVAVFEDLVIDIPGEGYRFLIEAPDTDLTPLITQPFDVQGDQVFVDRFEQQ